jgi:conjugative transposon TraK protein
MFTKMKNIDSAFRCVRMFSIVFIIACTIISLFIAYKSYQLASQSQQKIFVLANGKALEAYSADRKDNVPVEAKDHVKMFHQYFFTLDPDEKVIDANITKALYLADGSAKRQYDNLKETSYYSSIISGNISQQISIDSITVSMNAEPYLFHCYATIRIIRPNSIVTRNLITQGYLRNTSRSDNNPHGFLIERWETIENKDIKTENR